MNDIADRYRLFAETEARGNSPCYEQWCLEIADDAELLTLIGTLPEAKQQPNLVLGAARFVGATAGPYAALREWLMVHWQAVRDVTLSRSTQTNEVGRTAVLMPLLARLPGPLSLIEIGASAGLCLYPDRFSYRYDDRPVIDPAAGPSEVILTCATTGSPPIPDTLPHVVYRAGVDLNPLNVADPDDMRWLESLIWPDQPQRLARLRAAATIARRHRPHLIAGDLNDAVADAVASAPKDLTIVVFGSAVLAYLHASERSRFARSISRLSCHWISNEGVGVMFSPDQLPTPAKSLSSGRFVVAVDGTPVALAAPHGQTLDWLERTVD